MYRKYRKNYRGQPDVFDGLADILFMFIVLVGKLINKLAGAIFHSVSRPRQEFQLHVPASSALGVIQNSGSLPEVAAQQGDRYVLKQSLLSEAEKNFLTVLERVVEGRYRIEAQVQLSGIVRPVDSGAHFTNYRDFNAIKAKSIDFVLYDDQYKPYLAIELDDSSHGRWDRIKRDEFVNEIMKSVGLRIIHVKVSYSYDLVWLRNEILPQVNS